jgi:hypothetical protein
MTTIEIGVPEILLSVLETEAKQAGRTVPEEAVALLEEYLGTPEEVRALMDDLTSLKHEYRDIRAFSKELESEVSRRIKVLFHLDT